MPGTKTLHDAFIDELRDAYDAEKQLTKALPKMAKAATSEELRKAFLDHLKETEGHVTRLEDAFAILDEKVRGKHCDGIAGIIEEGKSAIEQDFDAATMDACLIASGQRAEHYEMAAYGSLVAWARAMGHTEAADLLDETLEEEKLADAKLTAIAEGGVNKDAASEAHTNEDERKGGLESRARKPEKIAAKKAKNARRAQTCRKHRAPRTEEKNTMPLPNSWDDLLKPERRKRTARFRGSRFRVLA